MSAPAVKEALMNAYAHCDWTRGGYVQIDVFTMMPWKY